MATKIEIDEAVEKLRWAAMDSNPELTYKQTSEWSAVVMPNGAWGLVRLNPDSANDSWSVMYVLGKTKGEALDHLLAMRQGIALTKQGRL